jgi:parallel beta helix pectate lyase-like protein
MDEKQPVRRKASWSRTALGASLCSCIWAASPAAGATFCVATRDELQAALTEAGSNAQDDSVLVVQGTYGGQLITSIGEAHVLAIEGGYVPGCGSRTVDPANTILDGGTAGVVLALAYTAKANITVNGVTVRNGIHGSGPGSGLYIATGGGDVTITNSVLSANAGDAALKVYGARIATIGASVLKNNSQAVSLSAQTLLLTNNTFDGNADGVSADGVSADGVSSQGNSATVSNNTFHNNGGICLNLYSSAPTFTITGNLFENNSCQVFYNNTASSSIFTSNTFDSNFGANASVIRIISPRYFSASANIFRNNAQKTSAGAILLLNAASVVIIEGNSFVGNSAQSAGALRISGSSGVETLVSHNVFRDNVATTGGAGAMLTENRTVTLVNNLFVGNSAATSGGALYVSLYDALYLTNNTLSGNTAGTAGAGLYVLMPSDNATMELRNNIFWNNSAAQSKDLWIDNDADNNYVPSAVDLKYNDFDPSAQGTYIHKPIAIDASNFDKVDPLFVDPNDPNQPDFHLQSTVGSYHGGQWLADPGYSPLIDAGDPNSPFALEPAPNGGQVNLGAYGNTVEASLSSRPASTPTQTPIGGAPTPTPTATATLTPTATPQPCYCPDTDQDGVPDAWDRCPQTSPGSFVDASGCPGGPLPAHSLAWVMVPLILVLASLCLTPRSAWRSATGRPRFGIRRRTPIQRDSSPSGPGPRNG